MSKSMSNQAPYFNRAIFTAVIATAVFLLTSVAWGLIDIYRFELCKPHEISCELATEAWMHPLRGAPLFGLSLFASLYIFKSTLTAMNLRQLAIPASLYLLALIPIYPFVFDLRELVTAQFFPYVISLRFGDIGFMLIWGFVTFAASTFITLLFVQAAKTAKID